MPPPRWCRRTCRPSWSALECSGTSATASTNRRSLDSVARREHSARPAADSLGACKRISACWPNRSTGLDMSAVPTLGPGGYRPRGLRAWNSAFQDRGIGIGRYRIRLPERRARQQTKYTNASTRYATSCATRQRSSPTPNAYASPNTTGANQGISGLTHAPPTPHRLIDTRTQTRPAEAQMRALR